MLHSDSIAFFDNRSKTFPLLWFIFFSVSIVSQLCGVCIAIILFVSHLSFFGTSRRLCYVFVEPNWFVCVEVLRPSQPNGAMSSAFSLPNHTFTGQT